MAHSNLGKAAGSPLAATEVNKLWSDDGSDNFETDGILSIDTISEKTSAAGVTIDSVLLKDGGAEFSSNIEIEKAVGNSALMTVDRTSTHSTNAAAIEFTRGSNRDIWLGTSLNVTDRLDFGSGGTKGGALSNILMSISGTGLGVGTTSPAGQFEVSNEGAGVTTGDFVVDTANSTVYIGRLSSTASDASIVTFRGRSGTAYYTQDLGVASTNATYPQSSTKLGLGKTPTEKLSIDLATEDLDIVDAGSAGATEQDWIEVKVGGNTGYLRVFASK